MRPSDTKKSDRRILIFIAASIFLHLGLFFFFYGVPFYRTETPQPNLAPRQDVVFVRPEDLVTAPPKSLPLVDLARPANETPPEKARFVSPYNSTVKDETVARRIPKKARADVDVSEESKRPKTPKKQKAPPKKVAEAPVTKTVEKPSPTPQPNLEDFSALGKRGSKTSKVSLSDLELKPTDFEEFFGDRGEGEKPKKPEFIRSRDTSEDEERLMAALHRPSGPGDHFVHDFMPGVKIGDKTYLNAAAMPNVQYFTRLKRIFRLRFNPRQALLSHFRHNRVTLGKINVTMGVEVSPSGHLQRLFVMRSSGIPGYDYEALRTVRQSAPFSAPPKAIQGKDGVLRMTWHFTTYL